MLCAVLAGLGLARGATAQEPQAGSPVSPTPYQSPLFHGGGSDPALFLPSPPFGTADPLLLNPLYGQLQGTPTAMVPGAGGTYVPVQIPSFDLGAYNPLLPPAGASVFYPSHLADGGIFSWQAPFNYVALATGTVTVDDTSPAPTPPAGATPGTSGFVFTPAGNWQQQTTGSAAGTATGGEYERLPPATTGTATWTLVATSAGSFSVYYHIPDQIADSGGLIEPRSGQVTYQISTSGTNAMTTTATVSQTEANATQFLAGPFVLAVGETVTVTLQRDLRHNQNTNRIIAPATTGSTLVADSMTLQTAIGDVRSSPTAINATAYPADFLRTKYWGIFVPAGTTNPVPATAGANAALADTTDTTGTGTPIYRYGNNTKSDPVHLIRQLVYFGRQDPTFSNGYTVDDNNPTRFATGGFSGVVNESTATNGEYKTAAPVSAGAGPTATWTLVAPNGGDYYATIHLPQTPSVPPGPAQKRITDAPYTVSVNGVPLTTQPPGGVFKISQAQTGDITLPTGAIPLAKGDVLTVTLTAVTGLTNPTGYTVVADSVRIATSGSGTGAIYCVDGFTGGVVWRFQTPGGLKGPSAPVFSSPVVAKINVMVKPPTVTPVAPAVYQNKLVVIVGDDNGMVYCLDAIGNGDGTSNSRAIDPNSGLPIYIPQPAYQSAPPTQVDQAGYLDAAGLGHVGTTSAYWVYRPDPNQPKYVTGLKRGSVKAETDFDVNSDLPVPSAFSTASPNVFVDPSVSTAVDATGSIPLVGGKAPTNAKVYVGNSNGVLYALDAVGVAIDATSKTTFQQSGDEFNVSYDLPRAATTPPVPTPQPLWWFSLRGANPNSTNNASSADIESAPALNTTISVANVFTPTVYIGSAHEVESTSNVGRLYALDGTYGPSGSNGGTDPSAQPDPTAPGYTGPGSLNYNIGQRPQINNADATDWSFPDGYNRTTGITKNNTGQSSSKLARPALGNITGSPVVFTDTNETDATRRTRIYFAANVGLEVPNGKPVGTAASPRPDDTETGRLWAVNLDGSVGRTTRTAGITGAVWSYPLANDPNNAILDKTPEPSVPLGAFLRATPAMGFVQFPSVIVNGNTSNYNHADAVQGNVRSQSIPMLYVATRGVNDTALYAVDVDGNGDAQRLIYRVASPDGSIFQSSPALIANSSAVGNGNGGAIYVVSGNTLYDFSATPISNPGIIDIVTGLPQTFPLIRENKAYTGFGPISSPTVSAADTLDLLQPVPAGYPYTTNATDWIYVGDSSTGFCRGITPFDQTDLGIPINLGGVVPQTQDTPGAIDLQAIMQVYLVNAVDSGSTNATSSALPVGATAPLPVYDWGQNVYIRFKNIAPPPDPSGNPNNDKIVRDSGIPAGTFPVQGYGRGGPIEFDLSDTTIDAVGGGTTVTLTPADHGTVPSIFLPTASTPLGNGFIARSDTDSGTNVSLVDSVSNKGYIGAYTYAISDGTARRNTPGSRRRVINAKQTVEVYIDDGGGGGFVDQHRTAVLAVQTTNGNEVSTPVAGPPASYTLTKVQPVDEPTFGILNPLAVRAGGIPLQLNPGTTPTNATQIGDEVGPFRGVVSPLVGGNDALDLEALANGNSILRSPPTSTSGGGGSPIERPIALTNPETLTHVVVTSTGLISHNTSGENFDAPPVGSVSLPNASPTGTGIASNGLGGSGAFFGSQTAPFAMDVADRSDLGPTLKRLRVKTGTISGGGAGLYWNDNSVPVSGHDSVVNYLPWETPPLGYKIGSNPSTDYPDIGPSDISATLHRYSGGSADLTLGNAIAEPATLNGQEPSGRRVYTNPVQFHISIPHFQPANQQLYRQTSNSGVVTYSGGSASEITPFGILTPNDNVFPMGYVTTRRVYIPDQNGFYRPGAAYRDIRVYTGVPPDYGLKMADGTAEVGSVPSGFGVQTSSFGGLIDATNGVNTFDPYNLDFQENYKPLKINNTGNVNLLNVHLDQKRTFNGNFSPLLMTSDALDITSAIPGYDNAGALTGPRSQTYPGPKGNVPEDTFLIRSSLDSDLVAAFGHNPLIQNPANKDAQNQKYIDVYPGATFHKAQVGSGLPSTLFVPDSPEGFVPGATLDIPPTNNPTHGPDGNNNNLPYKTAPFVSMAIPFGTPVGSYYGSLQAFEGLDGTGYSTVAANANPPGVPSGGFGGLTAQIYPPQYGTVVGGIGMPTTDAAGRLLDTIQTVQGPNSPAVSLMPNSSNATVLNVKVIEDRLTDGATFGAVPMIDPTLLPGAAPPPTPDFAPAAFRDPTSGNLSIYWTSGRTTSGATSPFNIWAANVPFNTAGQNYFLPSDPTKYWWKPFIPITSGTSTNSGLSIAQDSLNPGTVGAFVVNVQSPPTTAAYQNTLLYYPVTAASGILGAAQPITNDPTQVKYGVKGLFTGNSFPNNPPNLWAFWTATTRGRTAVYYNSKLSGSDTWFPATGPTTTGLLPIPAGLTAVADPAPLLLFGNVLVNGVPTLQATIDVTYSGTGADGNVDLYESRYQPDGAPTNPKPYQLDLVPFPPVTEILTASGVSGGWYQARDVAWSRTSKLNLSINGKPILYDATGTALFSRAVFDKATGLLVLTGVPNLLVNNSPTTYAFNVPSSTTVTAYIDLATGRVRFSAAPSSVVTASFSPLAKRMTSDSRADTGPTTFLDGAFKPNDTPANTGNVAAITPLRADRRWFIWRKSGAGGAAPSATVYYKTQRLTAYLPRPVDPTKTINISLNGTAYTGPLDVQNIPPTLDNQGNIKSLGNARIYFPISSGAEGATITGSYTATDGTSPTINDTVQWQDEIRANDSVTPPTNATTGLANIIQGYALPLDTTVNENNVSAFLDPLAGLSTPHKVWVFWNSTRNGTADLYYETINPLFAAQ